MTRPLHRNFSSCLAVLFATILSGCGDHPTEITGTGATFPAPLYARWIALFLRDHEHIHVHYRPIGSGGGIKAILAREVEFGASDAPLNESEQKKLTSPLLTIPTAMGPVVLAYNLPGLKSDLVLDNETVAGIYLGSITHWNDPKIQALNPGTRLPDTEIHPAHREDSSGTTYIFTDYLSAVSTDWAEKVGRGKTVNWPAGHDWKGEGNDGVAHRILLLPGGIGYLEMRYAQNAGLKYATLVNREGHPVKPTIAGVQSAEQNTPAIPGSLVKPSLVNAPGTDSYPICGYTYLLVYEDLTYLADPEKEHALLTFLKWALNDGQNHATSLHYVPLPDPVKKEALAQVDRIKHTPLEALSEQATSH